MATAVLGMSGTGTFGTPGTADERPKNWRETILHLFPNGEAPITAIMSKLKSKPTDDSEYNWWEKGLPTQRTQVNGAQTDVDTSIEVDDGVIFKKGHLVYNERTEEIVRVTVDPAANTLTVTRAFGEVAAAAMNDDDDLLICGTAYEEGADSPSIITYAPTKQFNYCGIERTTLGMTRTAKKTRLRWDKTGPYREAKREALQIHAIEMEKHVIFGQRKEITGPDGHPIRSTRGLKRYIQTNILTDSDVDGVWGKQDLREAFKNIFKYGSSEKLVLGGATFLTVFNAWAEDNTVTNRVVKDQAYGMHLVEVLTPFGTLYLKNHPLFSDHEKFTKDAVVLDANNLTYRYVDDTMFLKNRQSPGTDANKDEYLTEWGLQLEHEKTFAWFSNVEFYSASE